MTSCPKCNSSPCECSSLTKAEKDALLPPLEVELDFSEKQELQVGEISDPAVFEIGINIDPEHLGLVILFPSANNALLFKGEALDKLLTQVDIVIHGGVKSSSLNEFEEGLVGGEKKKVTLH